MVGTHKVCHKFCKNIQKIALFKVLFSIFFIFFMYFCCFPVFFCVFVTIFGCIFETYFCLNFRYVIKRLKMFGVPDFRLFSLLIILVFPKFIVIEIRIIIFIVYHIMVMNYERFFSFTM